MKCSRGPYLKNVALLDGSVLQLAGLLLEGMGSAAYRQAHHHLLWHTKSSLTHLHCMHLLLKVLHI